MDNDLNNDYFDPLTHREKAILQLLATGSSNQEIAEKLVIELSTVKWFNSQIFSKLQVKNRKQAVIRARKLAILNDAQDNIIKQVRHNLQLNARPFIGREQEISELVLLLKSSTGKLITILGPGGIGKSRLAIEVGRQLLPVFRHGVYFVSLVSQTSAKQVVTTIADVIDFKFHNDSQPLQQLTDYLKSRQMLLIVDNFEHLLDSADILAQIIETAPDVKIIVTSREKLELSGEILYTITGLPIPPASGSDISNHDSVKLFLEASQHSMLTPGNNDNEVVARICRMLGGMPLAIIMAADWLDTLSLSEIEGELKSGTSILESHLRDLPARHRSMDAVFGYSWKRLTKHEQLVFMGLSVFRGGFTREAAQTVAKTSIHDLQRLVHTSFIQHLPSGRYTIHELLRQYGDAKLEASGESEKIRENHAHYFAEFVAPLGLASWEGVSQELLDHVNSDHANIRSAWEYQLAKKNISELQRFINALWLFYDKSTRSLEGVDLFQSALDVFQDAGEEAALFRGQVLFRLSCFTDAVGQKAKAELMGLQAIQILENFDVPDDLQLAYLGRAAGLGFLGRYQEAIETNLKGIELARKMGGTRWQRILESQHIIYLLGADKVTEALTWYESLPESTRLEGNLGLILSRLGEYERAEAYLLKDLNPDDGHRWNNIDTYLNLVENAILAQNFERAWAYLRSSLQYVEEAYTAWMALDVLRCALDLLMVEQQYRRCTVILAVILNHPETMPSTRQRVEKYTGILKGCLPLADFEAAWTIGKKTRWEDIIQGLMICAEKP